MSHFWCGIVFLTDESNWRKINLFNQSKSRFLHLCICDVSKYIEEYLEIYFNTVIRLKIWWKLKIIRKWIIKIFHEIDVWEIELITLPYLQRLHYVVTRVKIPSSGIFNLFLRPRFWSVLAYWSLEIFWDKFERGSQKMKSIRNILRFL